jgi:multidrug efflux system membrane fusion protein
VLYVRVASSLALVFVLLVAGALYLGGGSVDLRALKDTAFSAVLPAPPPARPPPPPVPVSVAAARLEDVPILLSGIGTVQAYNVVAVKSRVDGEIMQVLFREGQDVKAGDALAIIDPRPFQAQLAQAQAMRAKDQATLEGALADQSRYATLVLKDFASRQQVDQQKALVEQTRGQLLADEAQIAYAQTQLGYTTIRSPLTGRVGIRQIDQGNFVHASDNSPLVTITQLQPISVVFALPAGAVAASKLTPGQVSVPVAAYGPDDSTKLDEGTVELVDTAVDPSTGTIKLKASFPNSALRLWPGNFVNGRLTVAIRKAALTIPAAALRHGPRGDFVWIARADGTVISKSITAGQAAGGRVMVESGLDKGAQVVTEGHFRLEDNTRIEVIKPPQANTPASKPAG